MFETTTQIRIHKPIFLVNIYSLGSLYHKPIIPYNPQALPFLLEWLIPIFLVDQTN